MIAGGRAPLHVTQLNQGNSSKLASNDGHLQWCQSSLKEELLHPKHRDAAVNFNSKNVRSLGYIYCEGFQ